MNGYSSANPAAQAFRVSTMAVVFLIACLASVWVPVGYVVAPALVGAYLWVVFRRPLGLLGLTLVIMPFHFLPVMIGQFFAVSHMTLISAGTKEIPFILVAAVLWYRNGFKPVAADYLLFGCFAIAAIRTLFGGDVSGLLLDFEFVIAYVLGRMTVLSAAQEHRWAQVAIWAAAILSLLGAFEVLVLGDGPRLLLYAALRSENHLPDSFRATGFEHGLRAASTMVGPPSLGALCMVALVIWWVYSRRFLPGALIGVGLVCALTRSAWIGSAVALLILAVRMHQMKRFIIYSGIAMVAFIAAIPVLGISDYLFHTRTGTDESEQVHRESELRGINYSLEHPLGSGAGTIGPIALETDRNAIVTENTYLAFAAQYGIAATLCFVAFLLETVRRAWSLQTQLAYAALGITIAFGLMILVLLMQNDFRLCCWVWFPIGLFLRTAMEREKCQSVQPA